MRAGKHWLDGPLVPLSTPVRGEDSGTREGEPGGRVGKWRDGGRGSVKEDYYNL